MCVNKMRYVLVIVLVFCFSCKKEKADENNKPINNSDEKINEVHSKKGDSVYVGVLQKFYDNDDYYVSLNFKKSVSTSFYNTFHDNVEDYIGELLLKTDDYQRYKIHDSVAKKYFDINHIDTLVVLDDNQKKIEEIYLKNYEYFSNQIDAEVIATYQKTIRVNKDKDYICMSKNDMVLKETQAFKTDTVYMEETINKNAFNPSYIHAHYNMIKDKDTISFLSFSAYNNDAQKEYFYLLKNKVPVDSIINDYSISKMLPVPLALKTENLYVAYSFIPDTGAFWNSLVGIDFENDILKYYENNRLYVPVLD